MKKNIIYISLIISTTVFCQEPRKFFIPPNEKNIISTDLHIHTVFSDGLVWPTVRVEEAYREGIELIAITDHLEYQPHKEDIPNSDKNRAFEIAKMFNQEIDKNDYINFKIPNEKLLVIPGVEITRDTPNPGHINAVFIKDANEILQKDSLSGVIKANNQNAFVFWNHPMWSQRDNGIARLADVHKFMIKNKLLHGIEVVNSDTFSEEAFSIALKENLTILGTSDIHGLTYWDYQIDLGGHRPMTFVISDSKKIDEIKKALFRGQTFIWFNDMIIGKEENIQPILKSNLVIESKGYTKDYTSVKISIKNKSCVNFKLEYLGEYSFYKNSKFIEVPKYGEIDLLIKTIKKREKLDLEFKIVNALIGPKTSSEVKYNLLL
tara:strand:+ start:898 stop:2031 length:1134 start_codon:yes stop_codon:yes gene_type:complete